MLRLAQKVSILMAVRALITKGAIVRHSLLISLAVLSLSSCTIPHKSTDSPYVDQSPGMTDTQLSLCISEPATSDAQRADCTYERDVRASEPSEVKNPLYRMNPLLNDGQWHSFSDKGIAYRKTDENGEYPSLYVKYNLKNGKSAIQKIYFDCPLSKSSISSSVTYSRDGDVIDSYASPYEIWNDILPDTNGASSLFQACLKII